MFNLSRKGQGTVEYVLMVSLAVVLVIAVMLFFGPTIKEFYEHVMGEDAMPGYQEEVTEGLEGE
jgi:Flp pilus assembly pilin Flp